MEICFNYASHTPSPYSCNAGACPVLNETCSGYNSRCSFYKTEEQIQESERKCKDRLRSLPESDQVYISDKFYGGKIPWNKALELRMVEARKDVS